MEHWNRRDVTRRQHLVGLAALAGAAALPSAGRAAGLGAAPRLHRGINLHNLLNWPEVQQSAGQIGYMWPPFEDAGHRMADGELRLLAGAGFDFVRLTMDPSILIVSDGPRWAQLERHIANVIGRLLSAGFSVVADLHPVSVNPAFAEAVMVDANRPDAFAAYTAMVGRVAAMLRPFPYDKVALELFNEPAIPDVRDTPRWQVRLEALHAAARAADPDRALVLNGLSWDSLQGLQALDVSPFAGSNVLYTFHYYDPHTFTHQGVKGQDSGWIAGLQWPENDANARDVLAAAQGRIAAAPNLDPGSRARAQSDTAHDLAKYQRAHTGADAIQRDFQSVAQWADQRGIARGRVLLGEFGCVNQAWNQPLGQDRLNWLHGVRTAAEGAGFPWAYWAYKGYGGMQLVSPDGGLDPDTLTALGLRIA